MRATILFVKLVVSEVNFEEDVSRKIEEDYVHERRTKKDFGQEQFKLALTLTKYIAIVEGNGKPVIEDFLKAKELVFEMAKRNDARYPPSKMM